MKDIHELFNEQQQLLLKLLADGLSIGEIGGKFKEAGFGDQKIKYFQNMIAEIKSLTGCKTEYRLAVLTERKKWLEQIEKSMKGAEQTAWQEGFANGFPRGIWRGVFYGVIIASIGWGLYIYFSN